MSNMSQTEILDRLVSRFGSQSDVAVALGFHRSYITHFYHRRRLSAAFLKRIRERVPELRAEAEAMLLSDDEPAHSRDKEKTAARV